jgi:putative ABC transport system substrate-binding protein
MKRRKFIGLLGGAAAWPLAARAQAALPVIGFLNGQRAADFAHLADAFRDGVAEIGYVEGRNVVIEFRWADGRLERLPELVADLIRRRVAVIVNGGTNAGSRTVFAATSTIPIVSTFGGDPVRLGLVNSISRPGNNVTGASIFTTDLEAKRFELLHELISTAGRIGVLQDSTFSEAEGQLREIEKAARFTARTIEVVAAGNETEIDVAFKKFAELRPAAVLVAASALFNGRREQIVALAARYAIPTMQETRESTLAGGLISYGTSVPDVYRKLGVYAGRILKGDKAGELPILQPTKFEFAINLRTAKALGLEIPPTLLARADEVIE